MDGAANGDGERQEFAGMAAGALRVHRGKAAGVPKDIPVCKGDGFLVTLGTCEGD